MGRAVKSISIDTYYLEYLEKHYPTKFKKDFSKTIIELLKKHYPISQANIEEKRYEFINGELTKLDLEIQEIENRKHLLALEQDNLYKRMVKGEDK